MNITTGDIILLKYPFTDKIGSKLRPAVVVSKDEFNEPLFVALQITSKPQYHKYNIQITDDMLTTPLKMPSSVNFNMIFTVHQEVIVKKISSFTEDALKNLTDKVKSLIF